MRTIPSVLVAVIISILFISPDARGGGVFPSPEPVSPGAPETVRLIADRCPTFSWSGVPGAWGYEIAIFSIAEPAVDVEPAVDGTVAEGPIAIDPDSTEPLVRARVPAGTSSWTPALEQCLVQGREYSWFIRETASPGRAEGSWSAASTFAVAESMVPPDQQREIDELIERLEALAVGFGGSSGESTLQPEFFIDDVYNFLTSRWVNVTDARLFAAQARNHAAGMLPKVTGMAPQLQEIIDIVRENLEFINAESSSAPGLSTEASRRPVRDAINEAKETLQYIVENVFEGKAEFVACETGSDCALLRAGLTNLLASFEDLVEVAGVRPDLDLARLKNLVENIPAPALFPVHLINQQLGITSEVDGLITAVEDIRELEPLLTGTAVPGINSKGLQTEAIEPCVWLEQDLVNRERNAKIAGYGLKAKAMKWKVIGKIMGAATTTKIVPQAGVHGYAGATIETDGPKTFINVANGIDNVFTFASDKILTTVSDCKAAREQQARDAQIQAIQDGLPAPELLVELEGLSSVPSDVVLTRTDVGLVKEDVGLVKTDVGLVKEDVVLTRTDVRLVKEDVGLVKTDVGLVKTDVGLVKEDVVLTRTDVGLVKEDVGLVKTDVGVVKEDVALTRTDVGLVKEDVGLVKTDFGVVKEDVALTRTDVGLVKEDVGLVKTDVGLVKGELGLVKTAVDDTKRVTDELKADLGEAVGVMEGLSSVPSLLDSTREDVGRVQTDVGLIRSAVDDTKRVTDEVKADLGGAVGILAAHDGRLTDLGTAVSSHDDAVRGGLEALVTRLEAVEADNEALRRARIESHVGSCTPTLGLLLPAVHGGELETVIETVEEAIGTAASIGMQTSKAEKSFAKGQESVSDQDYGTAFDWFCDAYQSLLN